MTTSRRVWMRSRKLFLLIAAGLASAALSYFGTGLYPIWWLLWLAPVPVLAIAPPLGGSAAFLLGSIAWLIGEMNQWNYVMHRIELPVQTNHSVLCNYCCCFRSWCFVRAQLSPARIALPGGSCFSCLLGHVRISYRDQLASQHMGQSRLHTNELSAGDPDCFDHRPLVDHLHHVFVFRRHCSPVERRGKTVSMPRACHRCRRRR